jgi:CHAD domain-containing protein
MTQYLLPEGLGVAEASASLSEALTVKPDGGDPVERTFYDTFDGRLHADGLALVHEAGRLALVDASTYAERAGIDRAEAPERLMCDDLPAGRLRDALEPIVEIRALLPIARVRGPRRMLRVLNEDAKTVVRLAVEAPALAVDGRRRVPLRSRVRVTPVRGYDDELAAVRGVLERELGATPAAAPLHDEAVVAAGGEPSGVASKPSVELRPGQRTDAAAVDILTALAEVVEANMPGAMADLDIEFLHDLRVAVRRSRSLQRQLRRAFPPEPLERFRGEFRWLQRATGAARDLDVYELELDRFVAEVGPELGPVRDVLERHRQKAHRAMRRALRSARAKRLLAEWAQFLAGLVEAQEDDRPWAARPIVESASARIQRVYRRMVRDGSAIDDESPPEALHELRKKGKELRYLLEFFSALYPSDVVKPMVKTLKSLQDTLGRFQDRQVQAETLRGLRDEVAAVEGGPAALIATGMLIERLEEEQAAARAEFAERFAAFAAKSQQRLVKGTFG